MKQIFRAILPLLLCLSLFLFLIPGAFAEDEQDGIPVRFTNENGYDLIGLHVFDAAGNAVEPVETGSVYGYLLTPGEYSYVYHDADGVFSEVRDSFSVLNEALEIPLVLTVPPAQKVALKIDVNPIFADDFDENDLAFHEQAIQAELDRVTEQVAAESGELSVSSAAAFNSTEDDIENGILALRSALVQRQPSVSVTIYTGSASWNEDNYLNARDAIFNGAFRHTGNQCEGDTLVWERASWARGGQYNNYDDNLRSYYHILSFSMKYISSASEEAQTAAKVNELVGTLGLNGKSDYEKILSIHQYLYNNVNYDDSLTRHSSYDALILNNSVCQGFATSFYRLCLAAGLDARVVSCETMNHAWDIVQLYGRYYYVDSTWDSNTREFYEENGYTLPDDFPDYFLRGSDWWLENHTIPVEIDGVVRDVSEPGDQFSTSYNFYDPAFASYIVSQTDFDPATAGLAIDEANFPDPAFRAYVTANFDTDGSDGLLSEEEIAAVTFIDVSYKPASPYDYQDFGNLDDLLDYGFQDAELELYQASLFSAPAESGADMQDNPLSLVLSNSAAFSAPDDTGVCTDGPVKSLKGIEYFTALKTLFCYGNQIEELDLSRNTELDVLFCGLRIDGVNYGNKLSSLDLSNNKKLRIFACDGNLLKTLDLSGNTELEMLQCIGNALESLIINNSPKLAWLYCWDNKLTSLDISGNLNLEDLDCGINALTSLSVAANTKLKTLECYNNAITELNVAGNTALEYLGCKQNQLRALDVRNHNALKELDCGRNNLNSLHLSGCGSLEYLYCFNNNLSSLDVTGCMALLTLECDGNALQSLDISKNTLLQMLWCCDNNLYDLDVSQNSELQRLWCFDNNLSDLDVSKNGELLLLSCFNNSLSRLDVTGNTALRGLDCHNNGLKVLNISPCAVLTQLITDVTPEIKDGVVKYEDNTETDTFRWLLFDEAVLLITPDMTPGFVLPAELTRIEDSAFAGIQNLITVYIPSSVTYIDPNAFGEIGELYIFGQTGSAAETFAKGSSAYTFIPAA